MHIWSHLSISKIVVYLPNDDIWPLLYPAVHYDVLIVAIVSTWVNAKAIALILQYVFPWLGKKNPRDNMKHIFTIINNIIKGREARSFESYSTFSPQEKSYDVINRYRKIYICHNISPIYDGKLEKNISPT